MYSDLEIDASLHNTMPFYAIHYVSLLFDFYFHFNNSCVYESNPQRCLASIANMQVYYYYKSTFDLIYFVTLII